MHAVVISEGGSLKVEERTDPVPTDSQVLLAVRSAGLNGADVLQRAGRYPAPEGVSPDIPGLEVAGEIIALGSSVRGPRVGDRVMALVRGGGQATRAAVTQGNLVQVPASLSWPEAGGFPEAFSTVCDALITRCRLAVGERLLVTGAAGGVGVAAVQLGRAAGASVIACVRDRRHEDELLALGATAVIDADAIGDHGPYDVVLELVGAPTLTQSLRALSPDARVAVIGVQGGAKLEVNLLHLMTARATIGGSTLRARSTAERALVSAAVRHHVLPLLLRGAVRVPVAGAFELTDPTAVHAAYERFTTPGKLGKVVLVHDEV